MSTRKLFQLFSIISLFLAPVSAWVFSGSGTSQLVIPLFFVFFAFYCIWFSRDEISAFGFLLILLPVAYKFNYFKFNLGNLLQFLGVSDFSINTSFLLYLVIFFVFFIEFLFHLKSFIRNPLFFLFISIVLWSFSSILWSSYPPISLAQFIIFSLPFVCGLLGFHFIQKNPGAFPKIVFYIIASSVFPILNGAWQLFSRDFFYEPDSGLGRIVGSFSHPNPFGLFLFFMTALSLVIFFSSKDKPFKKIIFFYLLILTLFLVLTYSRTAWISLAFFLLILAFFIGRKIFNLTIFSSILIFVILLVYPATQERIMGVFERTPFDSLYARENIFKMGWQKFQENPILGYGVGTFEEIIRDVKESSEGSASAHNDISLISVELGFIGIVLMFLSLLILFLNLIKSKPKYSKKLSFKFKEKNFDFNADIFFKGLVTLFLTLFFITGLAEAIFLKTILIVSFFTLIGGWLGKSQEDKKTTV